MQWAHRAQDIILTMPAAQLTKPELLERLAAGDEPLTAGALVDDRGLHGVEQVVLAARPAGIDQAHASRVAVEHLVAAEVDRVIAREL